jgi:hypothetical protein
MLLGIAFLVVGGAAKAAVAPLVLSPSAAAAGTRVTATATGLPAKTSVQLQWDGSAIGMPKARTSGGGILDVKFVVPDDTAGSHAVSAVALASNRAGPKSGQLALETVFAAGSLTLEASSSSPSATPSTPEPTPGAPATPTPSMVPSPTPEASSVSAIPTAGPTPSPEPATPAPTPLATPNPQADAWVNVINDQFNSGGVPAHWSVYDGPYGSGPHNCAVPSHVSVSGGSMHMLMGYESSGRCGAGWYTAGMYVRGAASVDQRVTVRFRVVNHGVTGYRIIPMRWPDSAPWPEGGEEDFCEGSSLTGCSTYFHYGSSNSQISKSLAFDLTQWHTLRFERLNHVVRAFVDDLSSPVWTYVGSSATLPDTLKRVVLQQECQSSCPSGASGTEDIQIDWITIDNPATP